MGLVPCDRRGGRAALSNSSNRVCAGPGHAGFDHAAAPPPPPPPAHLVLLLGQLVEEELRQSRDARVAVLQAHRHLGDVALDLRRRGACSGAHGQAGGAPLLSAPRLPCLPQRAQQQPHLHHVVEDEVGQHHERVLAHGGVGVAQRAVDVLCRGGAARWRAVTPCAAAPARPCSWGSRASPCVLCTHPSRARAGWGSAAPGRPAR